MDATTRRHMRALAEGWSPTTDMQPPDMASLAPNAEDGAGPELDAAIISTRAAKGWGVDRKGLLRVDVKPGTEEKVRNALAALGWRLAATNEFDGWTELVFKRS